MGIYQGSVGIYHFFMWEVHINAGCEVYASSNETGSVDIYEVFRKALVVESLHAIF